MTKLDYILKAQLREAEAQTAENLNQSQGQPPVQEVSTENTQSGQVSLELGEETMSLTELLNKYLSALRDHTAGCVDSVEDLVKDNELQLDKIKNIIDKSDRSSLGANKELIDQARKLCDEQIDLSKLIDSYLLQESQNQNQKTQESVLHEDVANDGSMTAIIRLLLRNGIEINKDLDELTRDNPKAAEAIKQQIQEQETIKDLYVIWPGNPYLTKGTKCIDLIHEAESVINHFKVDSKNIFVYCKDNGVNGDFGWNCIKEYVHSTEAASSSITFDKSFGCIPSIENFANTLRNSRNVAAKKQNSSLHEAKSGTANNVSNTDYNNMNSGAQLKMTQTKQTDVSTKKEGSLNIPKTQDNSIIGQAQAGLASGKIVIVADKYLKDDMEKLQALLNGGNKDKKQEQTPEANTEAAPESNTNIINGGNIQTGENFNAEINKASSEKIEVLVLYFNQTNEEARNAGKVVFDQINSYLNGNKKSILSGTEFIATMQKFSGDPWSYAELTKQDGHGIGRREYLESLIADVEMCRKRNNPKDENIIAEVLAAQKAEWSSALTEYAFFWLDCVGVGGLLRPFLKKAVENKPNKMKEFVESPQFGKVKGYLEDKDGFFTSWEH